MKNEPNSCFRRNSQRYHQPYSSTLEQPLIEGLGEVLKSFDASQRKCSLPLVVSDSNENLSTVVRQMNDSIKT